MKEILCYRLVDLEIRITTPFQVNITNESREFCHRESGHEMAEVKFEAVTRLPQMPKEGVWYLDRYFVQLNGYDAMYIRALPTDDPYAVMIYGQFGDVRCMYLKDSRAMIPETHYLLNLIGLEKILLCQKGLILHASFIRWNNQGILFSASSGTGKSTQADLWGKYMGAEIINGDRAGIRKKDDVWRAYGLPYAGSSRIYCNESAPLQAIVVLEQAEDHSICRLSGAEAMRRLLPEFSLHRWNSDFMKEAMNLVMEMLKDIPVYLLKCRPDKGAVESVRNMIEKEEMK